MDASCRFLVSSFAQSHQLVDREYEHTEHKVCHDFHGASNANVARSKLVLQTPVYPLHHGALLEALLFGPGELTWLLARHDYVLGLASSISWIHYGHVT